MINWLHILLLEIKCEMKRTKNKMLAIKWGLQDFYLDFKNIEPKRKSYYINLLRREVKTK